MFKLGDRVVCDVNFTFFSYRLLCLQKGETYTILDTSNDGLVKVHHDTWQMIELTKVPWFASSYFRTRGCFMLTEI
jgi:hypothetical protein